MLVQNYDPRGLLSSITTLDHASAVLKNFTYGLNSLGQRATITREDSAVLAIGYDARRQFTSGQKTTAGGSARPAAITYTIHPLDPSSAI